jgi:hypothetical protein
MGEIEGMKYRGSREKYAGLYKENHGNRYEIHGP